MTDAAARLHEVESPASRSVLNAAATTCLHGLQHKANTVTVTRMNACKALAAVGVFWMGGLLGPLLTAAAAIRVEPARVLLHVDGQQQLLVTGVDGRRQVDRTTAVEYSSSHADVVTVSSAGIVQAKRTGTAIISIVAGGEVLRVRARVAAASAEPPIRFNTDVVPILTKLGCNSGGCHGKATGQNGFKLSLLGFEPEQDYLSIVNEARGRRLFLSDPDRSLLLLKASAIVPHGGGRRLEIDSDDYRVLQRWVARGASAPSDRDPVLRRIDVRPRNRVLSRNSRQQLLVTAHFSDGTSRDVTRQAVFQSNEPEIASVDASGLVQTNSNNGLCAVMVRFGGQLGAFHAAIPFESHDGRGRFVERRLAQLSKQLGDAEIDRLLVRQWKRLGILPSQPADDATFIRRVTIDICGSLPTPEETERYIADTAADKRARLIDELLSRREYASYFALKWADILRNRGAGYSTRNQRRGTTLFASWIRDSIAANKPYDQFVREILTASGSQEQNPPTIWYRSVRTLPDYVESVAQAFLGVRIQCAQCHHHPFERWSQADYYGLAAVFARVGRKGGFADAEVPTSETIYLKDSGKVLHPRTGQLVQPRALGGPDFVLGRYEDPRQHLARWMTATENPFFARTMVNRIWAHFLGRGIIHPIDDARSSNPPTNPELLDALAAEFAASGYDVQHLIRLVCNSYAYGLSAATNQWNEQDTQTFARFYPRRLTAEVLLDGISQVLEVPTEFSGGPGSLPKGIRAIDLPDENVPAHFLDVFGRPARTSACECERVDAPALAQALELVNSQEIHRKLTASAGYAQRLATNGAKTVENVEDIFMRIFARPPSPHEMETAVEFLRSETDLTEAYRSLLWSLLATNEFLFNH